MNVLGVDTGLTERNPTAWALYLSATDTVIEMGAVSFSSKKFEWHERAQKISAALEDLAGQKDVRAIAIETPWVGRDPSAALKLGALLGGLLHAAGRLGIPAYLISPAEGARALGITGQRKEKKAAAIKMIEARYGLKVSDHQADAIGAALAAAPQVDLVLREQQQEQGALV